jgi:hypothetical protein
LGYWSGPRALRRRGFIDDHSDAIGCAPPDALCRLIGRRACVEDHLRPVTGGTYDSRCRRLGSPQSSREVPAETPRSPPAPAGGRGHSGRIGVRGSETSGGSPGTGGPVWPLEVPVRGAVAHRLRPVGISAQARSVTAGAGLAFHVPARSSVGPPRTSSCRAPRSVKGKLAALVPSGPLTLGGGALGVVEGQGELLAGSRAVLGRYVVMSSGVVKPARMSQV